VSNAAAAQLALEIAEKKGGGGGGGGGGGHHGAKNALASIDDIAARNSLNIEARKKTPLERQAEIDKMQAELAAQEAQVGEKDPDAEEDEQQRRQPESEDEPA